MGETTGWLKTIQDRFGPLVWFVGTVLLPAVGALAGGLAFMWKAYIFPAIQSQLRDAIQQELRTANEKNEKTIENYNALFEQLKQKYANELDSTYYLEKTFDIDFDESEQASMSNQDVLSTFFYFVDKDIVKLYIWSSGSSGVATDMEISINDGDHKTPQDFHKNSWSNIDITPLVKNSSALSGYQYIGIGENVYSISIIPKPTVLKKRESTKTAASPQKIATSKLKERKEVTIYALVIVRRSPFQ